jgi:DNA mismatch repair protein MutL
MAFLFGGPRPGPGGEPLAFHLEPRHGIPAQPAFLVQLHGTFLLCPAAEGLLIVDQHSAHERVHYERLRERLRRLGRNPEVQSLIFPEPLHASAEEALLLAEMDAFLRRVGFDLVAGGPRDFLVQSAPAALSGRTVAGALQALMEIYADDRDLGVRSGELSQRLDAVEERMLRSRRATRRSRRGSSFPNRKCALSGRR